MNGERSSSGRGLSTLDYVISVMDSPQSQLDFTIAFKFRRRFDLASLQKGATSARKLFPISASSLRRNRWVPKAAALDGLNNVIRSFEPNVEEATRSFVNRPLDLCKETPVRQLVIINEAEETTTLVTKFHHAAADGRSAALWLNHQLSVAGGFAEPLTSQSAIQPLPIKQITNPVRRSEFAYNTPSDRLWTSNLQRSGRRAWITMTFEADSLKHWCRGTRSFTYNDLLATCALEVFRLWNRERCGLHTQRIGLWLPINVRRSSAEGFGNGTSRIRIYANYPESASLNEKCRAVRHQVRWCITHGEWAVPQLSRLALVPRWISAPFLRRHLSRASIDMATGVFSHAESWNDRNEVFSALERLECIGLLHPNQSFAINGATHNGITSLTFTYDTGLFEPHHVAQLIELYFDQLELARRMGQEKKSKAHCP